MNKPAKMTVVEIIETFGKIVVEHIMQKVITEHGHVMELHVDEDGDIVPMYERNQVNKGIYRLVGEPYTATMVVDIRYLCDCKRGFKNATYDGRGLFLFYSCGKCYDEKMKGYRADIMEPDYWHDEPLDCE